MKSAAVLQNGHNPERLQLPSPAHSIDLSPVLHWAMNGRAGHCSTPPLCSAGSEQLLWQLPRDGRAAAVSCSDPE